MTKMWHIKNIQWQLNTANTLNEKGQVQIYLIQNRFNYKMRKTNLDCSEPELRRS